MARETINTVEGMAAALGAAAVRHGIKATAEAAGLSVGGLHELIRGRSDGKGPNPEQWKLGAAVRVAKVLGFALSMRAAEEPKAADVPGQGRLFSNPKGKGKARARARAKAKRKGKR